METSKIVDFLNVVLLVNKSFVLNQFLNPLDFLSFKEIQGNIHVTLRGQVWSNASPVFVLFNNYLGGGGADTELKRGK
jgi:hypothetical protein